MENSVGTNCHQSLTASKKLSSFKRRWGCAKYYCSIHPDTHTDRHLYPEFSAHVTHSTLTVSKLALGRTLLATAPGPSQCPRGHPSSHRAAQARSRWPNIHLPSTFPTSFCRPLSPSHLVLQYSMQYSLRLPLLRFTPIPSNSREGVFSIPENHPF